MGSLIQLGGRGLRYIRRHGAAGLYRKVMERKNRNEAEAGYDGWLRKQLPDMIETEKQKGVTFPYAPCISILVPAYETPETFLREMAESVLKQSYGNLELCVADGSPTDNVQKVMEEYAAGDSRVKYRRLERNLGISENTNEALALASGDYVGLLDHDDLLLPGALFEIVTALQGGAEALYTDEDKANMDLSHHFQPHFKPDYNQEYLRSNNYICHFFVVKTEIARKVGGFRAEFDGAQDHDFIFRCTEEAKEVLHLPKVLYSWRCHQASTASNPESKLYAYEAGKRAVAAHLERTGRTGTLLDTENFGFYRVNYPGDPEIFIKSLKKIDGQTGVKVVYYDKACNNSVTISGDNDYVLFTRVQNAKVNQDFWKVLKACCDRPETGLACARVYGEDGELRSDIRMKGVRDPFSEGMKGLKKGYTGYFHRAVLQQELEYPTDCYLIRTELLKQYPDQTAEKLWTQLQKDGYAIYYEPWAVMYESRQ